MVTSQNSFALVPFSKGGKAREMQGASSPSSTPDWLKIIHVSSDWFGHVCMRECFNKSQSLAKESCGGSLENCKFQKNHIFLNSLRTKEAESSQDTHELQGYSCNGYTKKYTDFNNICTLLSLVEKFISRAKTFELLNVILDTLCRSLLNYFMSKLSVTN